MIREIDNPAEKERSDDWSRLLDFPFIFTKSKSTLILFFHITFNLSRLLLKWKTEWETFTQPCFRHKSILTNMWNGYFHAIILFSYRHPNVSEHPFIWHDYKIFTILVIHICFYLSFSNAFKIWCQKLSTGLIINSD